MRGIVTYAERPEDDGEQGHAKQREGCPQPVRPMGGQMVSRVGEIDVKCLVAHVNEGESRAFVRQ